MKQLNNYIMLWAPIINGTVKKQMEERKKKEERESWTERERERGKDYSS